MKCLILLLVSRVLSSGLCAQAAPPPNAVLELDGKGGYVELPAVHHHSRHWLELPGRCRQFSVLWIIPATTAMAAILPVQDHHTKPVELPRLLGKIEALLTT